MYRDGLEGRAQNLCVGLCGLGQRPVDFCQHNNKPSKVARVWECSYLHSASYCSKSQLSRLNYEQRSKIFLPVFRHFLEVQKMFQLLGLQSVVESDPRKILSNNRISTADCKQLLWLLRAQYKLRGHRILSPRMRYLQSPLTFELSQLCLEQQVE